MVGGFRAASKQSNNSLGVGTKCRTEIESGGIAGFRV